MSNGCTKVSFLDSNSISGVVKVLDVDDPSLHYQIHRLKEYCHHLEEVLTYGTVSEISPYTLVIDAVTHPCSKPDYFNLVADLEEIYDIVDGIHTFCVLICGKDSPLRGVWENKSK